MYSRTRAFAPGSEEAGKGGERRGGERGKGHLQRQSSVPCTWGSLDSRGESSGEGPIRGRRSQRGQRQGWARRARAHLAQPAVSLLPELLLQLFVQSAHLPLVFTLPPSGNRDTIDMIISEPSLCPLRESPDLARPGQPSPPQRLLKTFALPGRCLQAGRCTHQNFL